MQLRLDCSRFMGKGRLGDMLVRPGKQVSKARLGACQIPPCTQGARQNDGASLGANEDGMVSLRKTETS